MENAKFAIGLLLPSRKTNEVASFFNLFETRFIRLDRIIMACVAEVRKSFYVILKGEP